MKYKVGDRVRIKSLDWYNKNKTSEGCLVCGSSHINPEMICMLGKIATISSVEVNHYRIKEYGWNWTDEMIEGLVEEETKPLTYEKTVEIIETMQGIGDSWECPQSYQFVDENGNVINATKIVLEKKKKSVIREKQIDNAAQEYIDSDNAVLTYSDGFCEQTDHPFVRAAFKAGAEWADNDVTQDDCSKAPKLTSEDYSNGRFGYRLPAGFKAKLTERELILTPEKPEYPKSLLDCENVLNSVRNDRKKLLHKFNELLICRDAYWKIAGEEMGLDKPWEPDWLDDDTKKYVITSTKVFETFGGLGYINYILTFPTAEMRDAFYENFKELIESVKELL